MPVSRPTWEAASPGSPSTTRSEAPDYEHSSRPSTGPDESNPTDHNGHSRCAQVLPDQVLDPDGPPKTNMFRSAIS